MPGKCDYQFVTVRVKIGFPCALFSETRNACFDVAAKIPTMKQVTSNMRQKVTLSN